MGASTSFRVFKDSLGIPEIKKQWAAAVEQSRREDGCSYSGAIGMLGTNIGQWYDKEHDEERAYEWIETTHQKWKSGIACSFIKNGVKYWLIGGWCSS